MDPVLSAVLGSMQADLARMDRVAMNLANLQTPGYKREVAAEVSFADRVQRTTAPGTQTDLRPGTLKPTGRALDFALAGPGWFEVLTPQGLAYTRQGNFRLDANGRVVTQQGHPVMGLGGEMQLASDTPVADAAGRLFDAAGGARAGAAAAQLKVVQFEAGAAIQRLGDGMVLPQGTPSLLGDGVAHVQQGVLENSNVSHMHEMVRLLETVRHLETLQKVATGYDEMLASSIRKLGDAS